MSVRAWLIIFNIIAFLFLATSVVLYFFFPRQTHQTTTSGNQNSSVKTSNIGPEGGDLALNYGKCQIKVTFPPKLINQNVSITLQEAKNLPAPPNENVKQYCPFSIVFGSDPKISYAQNLYDEAAIPLTVQIDAGEDISKSMNVIGLLVDNFWLSGFRKDPVQQGNQVTEELYLLNEGNPLTLNIELMAIPIISGT